MHIEIDSFFAQKMRKQHFGVQPRRFRAVAAEVLLAPFQYRPDGPDLSARHFIPSLFLRPFQFLCPVRRDQRVEELVQRAAQHRFPFVQR